MAKIEDWADKAKIETHRKRIESLKARAIELAGGVHGAIIERNLNMIQASTFEIMIHTVQQWLNKYDDLKLSDFENMLNENLVSGKTMGDELSNQQGYSEKSEGKIVHIGIPVSENNISEIYRRSNDNKIWEEPFYRQEFYNTINETLEDKDSMAIETEDLKLKIEKLNLQFNDLLVFTVPEGKRQQLNKALERMLSKYWKLNFGGIGILILDDDIKLEKENAFEYYDKIKKKLEYLKKLDESNEDVKEDVREDKDMIDKDNVQMVFVNDLIALCKNGEPVKVSTFPFKLIERKDKECHDISLSSDMGVKPFIDFSIAFLNSAMKKLGMDFTVELGTYQDNIEPGVGFSRLLTEEDKEKFLFNGELYYFKKLNKTKE